MITTAGKEPWNRGRKLPPEVLTGQEVNALLGACSKRAPTGIRNRALIAVLYRGQLRIGETLALKPKDLDRKAGTVRVLHGKGDRARTVGLDSGAWALLELWLQCRQKLGPSGRHPLFCTLEGGPLLPSYCRSLLARLGKKAGIEKRVHPHGLRHSRAAESGEQPRSTLTTFGLRMWSRSRRLGGLTTESAVRPHQDPT